MFAGKLGSQLESICNSGIKICFSKSLTMKKAKWFVPDGVNSSVDESFGLLEKSPTKDYNTCGSVTNFVVL